MSYKNHLVAHPGIVVAGGDVHILLDLPVTFDIGMATADVPRPARPLVRGLLNRIIDDNYRMNGKDMTQVDAKYVPAAASKIRLFAPC